MSLGGTSLHYMQPRDCYSSLLRSYLHSGLGHSLLHMRSRFRQLIPDEQYVPSEADLSQALINFQLNDIEFALAFHYYQQTYSRVPRLRPLDLVMLCAFHAKSYFNDGMEMYIEALSSGQADFFTQYRAFANEYCEQKVSPLLLNTAFELLRCNPEPPIHYSYDLNYQANVLMKDQDTGQELMEDTPCYQVQRVHYNLCFLEREQQTEGDSLVDHAKEAAKEEQPFPSSQDSGFYFPDPSRESSLSSRAGSFFSNVPLQ